MNLQPNTVSRCTNPAETKTYKHLLNLTIVVALVIFFYGLGDIALLSFNEARRALPEREMFETGDWLLPHLNGELYITKPPLLYWFVVSIAHVFGSVNEWVVRLPSALAASATAYMVYQFTLKRFGAWSALFALQILIANTSFAMFARRAEIEMLLTALCIGALFSAIRYLQAGAGRGWIYLSYFLLALAMLTKGPLVLLLVTLPIIFLAIVQRDTRSLQLIKDPVGWAIFLLVGLSWYVAVTWRLGPDIWAIIAKKDIVGKINGDSGKPLFSYLFWILVDFLPTSLLVLLSIKHFKISVLQKQRLIKIRPNVLLLIFAVVVPLVIFSLFSNKHAKYLLPIYPVIAIYLGVQLAALFNQSSLIVRRLVLLSAILLPVGYAIYYAVLETKLFEYRVAVFPQLHSWSVTQEKSALYGYEDLDERVMYYSANPINMLSAEQFKQMRDTKKPFTILVDGAHLESINQQAGCVLKEFKPYLKKHKTLTALNFNVDCSH